MFIDPDFSEAEHKVVGYAWSARQDSSLRVNIMTFSSGAFQTCLIKKK